MIITFCGHSDYIETAEDEQKILSLLEERVGDRHAELFLGGYGAFDEFARQCGKKYQATHPNTKLIFVTPYITEHDQQNLYDDILYPSLENVPPRFAIAHRNRRMVERADLVIAYITHTFGGAYQTYVHAKRLKKEIFNLAQ